MPKAKALKRIFGKKKTKIAPQTQFYVTEKALSTRQPSVKTSSSIGSTTIVCDLGSAWTRIGFASSRVPPVQMPSWVGRPPSGNNFFQPGEAETPLNSTVFQAVKNGRIVDLDAVSFLLDTGFRRIGALTAEAEDLSARNFLLALRPSEDRGTKERLFQSLMETYRINGCFFALQQPLALYATARSTGLVLDSGEGITHAVPVHEGHPLLEAIETLDIGGDDVTDTLLAYLTQWDFRVRSRADRDAVNRMKERVVFVAPTPGRAPVNRSTQGFQLPDGRNVALKDERYLCAEPLFNPGLLGEGNAGQGMAEGVLSAIRKCPGYVQIELRANIFPFGGCCRLKGFDQRLNAEMIKKLGGNAMVRRPADAARQTACWVGGAAWARTAAFADTVVTRAEYEEEGLRAFQRKCS